MEVKEAIEKRRSIRKYLDKEISEEIIQELIKAARLAPSAYNAQPWKFKIVNDKKIIQELKNNQVFKNPFVYTAPLIIVCCCETDVYPLCAEDNFNTRELAIGDISIASQNLVLRATELGLGSCYVGLLSKEKIKQILKIPKRYVIPHVISIGYPSEKPADAERKNIDDILL